MTGREKIEAAFSAEGTPQIPAVIPYEGIYVRDHWDELTSCPWWYQHVPAIEQQMQWRREVIARTGQDWLYLPLWHTRGDRENTAVEVHGGEVFLLDRRTGRRERLPRPRVGGWDPSAGVHSYRPATPAQTFEEIDAAIPLPPEPGLCPGGPDGSGDLAAALLKELGHELYPISHVSSPLWLCYNLWGFEGMMEMIALRPDLVRHACRRCLALAVHNVRSAAAIGAQAVWIEECFTDAIGPQAFESLNVPVLCELIGEVRRLGMKSIYYYCGNPAGKWELLFSVGADALSLEESKKGFLVDIDDVVDRARGRCAVFGNLDAINLLPKAGEQEVRTEILRQIAAGRRNGSRFVMSLGSPVTPATPVDRVRLYCDLVHQLGK